MNPDNPVTSSHRNGAGATGRPKWWFRRARTGATLAACLYVVVWSALLGSFADNLTIGQEVLMAVAALDTKDHVIETPPGPVIPAPVTRCLCHV